MFSKRILLVTGANTGIGYETVKALLQSERPYHIILGSRSADKGEAAITQLKTELPSTISSLELIQVDVADDDSILKAFQTVKDKHGVLDVLVNNAGASHDFNPQTYNPDDIKTLRRNFNKSYDVNTSGTHVITHVFVPLLLKSTDPRVLFVTSGLSDLHGLETLGLSPLQPHSVPPAGWPKPYTMQAGYRSSKAALNMVMLNWHWLLKADGVKVWCISPGFLATGLGGNPELLKKMGAGEPSDGGNLIKKVVEGERDADVGKVVNKGGIQSW
ncbi:Short-chain dehydrogenase/reductase tropE [Colletotrichum shisoi]|uniref:Short-chain dehydrogenase/reductase tropE n=1 Tax=Colletotrichum shisoi TaxID=2078593 RepID=A0A5Q4BEX4_9PEZI|nr:Short-chain dehydrogenase/reductase tropE [Colletotrichum shisoi]